MSRRTKLVAGVAAGLAAGAGMLVLVALSDHDDSKALTGILGLLIGWSFIGSGLLAWWRRPDNGFGALMTLVGFTWFLSSLTEANASVPFTIGVAVGDFALVVFAQAVLAYPGGRLGSAGARTVIGLGWLIVGPITLVRLFFDGLPDCDCPDNALLVRGHQSIGDAIGYSQNALGVVVVLGIIVLLVRRWHRATAPLRRALGPVFWTGGATAALLGVQLVVDLFSHHAAKVVYDFTLIAFASVPLAFLAGLLRTRLARAAVGELIVALGRTLAPGSVRDALARALGDDALRLAYWLPSLGGYVDATGRAVELPGQGGPRVATRVEHEGHPVAALVHDRSLLDDPALLEAVGAAAGLALENERLNAELRARLDDLGRERDFADAVVRTAPNLVIVFEPDGRIVRFNQACERLTGYRFDEVRGKRFWDLFIDPAEAPGIERALAGLGPDELPSQNENHWLTRDGQRRLIIWRNAALGGDDGTVRYIVSGGVDVTDYRRQQAELKASRARIVEIGDAERRRLERNLHDGAQQRLVSISLALRLARSRLADAPQDADTLLEGAAEELAHALEELRELARGIHPAVLTDRGLDAALESLTARVPLPVELETEIDGRLPGPVEAAAYYVVSEALANIAKYAHASAVEVSVRRLNGAAVVEVADDGVGGADPDRGSGLRGLRDRVEALDGSLEVESEPGRGTLIRAEIPCG